MLIVHRAADGRALVHGLADVLAEPPDDPFTPEVVAVPAKGVERWITQRLSHTLGARHGDGVCANVTFPWPGTMLDDAVCAASQEHADSVQRWAPERSTWSLLEVIDASRGEPWSDGLHHHLGSLDEDKGRRFAVAARLARSFDEYGRSRPQMLRDWAAGDDTTGDGQPLDDDLHWQPELWRRLREHLGTPSPAELLDDACARLRAAPRLSGLPSRLSVFGASRLTAARLLVLAALAEHRDVHLWLHHASPALWTAGARARDVLRRAEDHTRAGLANPLLASLSRDLLELQHLLRRHAPAAADVLHPTATAPGTLLGRLRQDLAEDRVPADPPPLDPADRSVQVHACHGRTRQVEVLREVILGLLAADPTLEPRDVLVMCPDVEAFAPLVAAAFSLGTENEGPHPAARLRVRLADRSLRQTNALLEVMSRLLELGTARVTASEVLDLAGRAAVRRRFGFDDDDLERLRGWVAGTGIRWGLTAEHRVEWQLGDIAQGTWRAGLDRLLLGVAVEGGPHGPGDVVPLDDVDSADIDLAGRLAELLDRLDAARATMAGRHTATEWTELLETTVLGIAAPTADNAWQRAQLHTELADLADAAAASSARLSLADVRALLQELLAGRPTRAGFRTGTLTVCTLVPMRSVPHRVVCLLGLDDGSFPRQSTRDGDDVLARDPWVGERDPRSEDRQLLLDALCAAEEHLVITYSGADDRTGATIPPAVPLGEVLDALDRAATAPAGARVRDVITTRHPLQPFDARNFTPGRLGTPGPFSFDTVGMSGALAAAEPRTAPPRVLGAALPARAAGDVDLADLRRLLQHPARGFLRQRLDVAGTFAEEEPGDAMPVEYDDLEKWALGERLLALRLDGVEPAACMDLELRRGLLPPGPLGVALLQDVGRDVEGVVRASADERLLEPESIDVDVPLPDGTRLAGTVGGVRGDVALSLSYSRLSAKHRLLAWIDLVVLCAARPGRPWRSIAVARGSRGAVRCELGPLDHADALATAGELVALYRSGLRAPLPLPLKSAAAYADRRARGSGIAASRTAAEEKWLGGRFPGEHADAEHELLHGRAASLDVLTDEPPWPDEGGDGWPADETDRFGLLARRLWTRLLAAERQVRR